MDPQQVGDKSSASLVDHPGVVIQGGHMPTVDQPAIVGQIDQPTAQQPTRIAIDHMIDHRGEQLHRRPYLVEDRKSLLLL